MTPGYFPECSSRRARRDGLRRAALGIIRIIRNNNLRVRLLPVLSAALQNGSREVIDRLMVFIFERLRIQLRVEGARHDVLAAIASYGDDDLNRVLSRTKAIADFLSSPDGSNLLVAYKRAANILRIEERKDGAISGRPEATLLIQPEELILQSTLNELDTELDPLFNQERFEEAMAKMATLRAPLDAFFDHVTVNAPEPDLRRNRLRLLNRVRATMDRVADFSQIEG